LKNSAIGSAISRQKRKPPRRAWRAIVLNLTLVLFVIMTSGKILENHRSG
jgi:hypothetical protein